MNDNNLKTVYFLKQADKEDDISTLLNLDERRQIENKRLKELLKRAEKGDFDDEMDWYVGGTPLTIKEQLQIHEIVKDPNVVLNRGGVIWIPSKEPSSGSTESSSVSIGPKTILYEIKLCGRLIVPKFPMLKFLL